MVSSSSSLGAPVVPLNPFFGGEGSPTKIDYRKMCPLILPSLLEDLALVGKGCDLRVPSCLVDPVIEVLFGDLPRVTGQPGRRSLRVLVCKLSQEVHVLKTETYKKMAQTSWTGSGQVGVHVHYISFPVATQR